MSIIKFTIPEDSAIEVTGAGTTLVLNVTPMVERTSILKINTALRGYSAYEIAVQQGFIGTIEEWVSSVSGNYNHIQSSPSTTWTINHNLGKYPSIELLSVGLVKFNADITHTSLNQSIVYLLSAQAGIAQCN